MPGGAIGRAPETEPPCAGGGMGDSEVIQLGILPISTGKLASLRADGRSLQTGAILGSNPELNIGVAPHKSAESMDCWCKDHERHGSCRSSA